MPREILSLYKKPFILKTIEEFLANPSLKDEVKQELKQVIEKIKNEDKD